MLFVFYQPKFYLLIISIETMIFRHSQGLQVGTHFLFWSFRKSYEDAVGTQDFYLFGYIEKLNVHSITCKSDSAEPVIN